jgi:hypothetical protein
MRRTIARLSAMALGVSLAAAGCTSRPSQGDPTGRLSAKYAQDSGRLASLTYDRNKDGKVDTWATMDGPRVVRIDIDENGDGKIDRWEHYKPGAGANADVVLERVDTATRRDGRISRREFLVDGRLSRIEEDTDDDGAVDKWEVYREGALVSVDLDTRRSGKPDRRLIYGAGGSLERIEADPDGTGRFQPIKQDR